MNPINFRAKRGRVIFQIPVDEGILVEGWVARNHIGAKVTAPLSEGMNLPSRNWDATKFASSPVFSQDRQRLLCIVILKVGLPQDVEAKDCKLRHYHVLPSSTGRPSHGLGRWGDGLTTRLGSCAHLKMLKNFSRIDSLVGSFLSPASHSTLPSLSLFTLILISTDRTNTIPARTSAAVIGSNKVGRPDSNQESSAERN